MVTSSLSLTSRIGLGLPGHSHDRSLSNSPFSTPRGFQLNPWNVMLLVSTNHVVGPVARPHEFIRILPFVNSPPTPSRTISKTAQRRPPLILQFVEPGSRTSAGGNNADLQKWPPKPNFCKRKGAKFFVPKSGRFQRNGRDARPHSKTAEKSNLVHMSVHVYIILFFVGQHVMHYDMCL